MDLTRNSQAPQHKATAHALLSVAGTRVVLHRQSSVVGRSRWSLAVRHRKGAQLASTSTTTARYPALRHRNFTLIWSGLLVSNMGTWMQSVAQSWLIYKLTGNNPLYLGWLGLAFAIPMIVVPPLGGALADRVDRIRLLYVTQTCSLLLA